MPGTGARANELRSKPQPFGQGLASYTHGLCRSSPCERMNFISYILRFFFSVFLNTAIQAKANITIKVKALAGI